MANINILQNVITNGPRKVRNGQALKSFFDS